MHNDSGGSDSGSPVGSGSDSAPSRSRSRSAAPAQAGVALVAKRYRNPMQSLDFSGIGPGNSATGGSTSIEDEMNHYCKSPIPPRKTTDMIGYWMNHGRVMWPRIYRLFTDYAAIQATSVPSEPVFSSSAETDTKRRNHISPMLMEALQMLKFNFKKSRLNFTSEWQSPSVADDDEDWLRDLAAASDEQRDGIRREVADHCDFTEMEHMEMPEEIEG